MNRSVQEPLVFYALRYYNKNIKLVVDFSGLCHFRPTLTSTGECGAFFACLLEQKLYLKERRNDGRNMYERKKRIAFTDFTDITHGNLYADQFIV
jgi:hypothetical protein